MIPSARSGAGLLLGEAPPAADHLELGRKIARQNQPAARAFAHGEFPHQGLALHHGKDGAQLLVALALPGHLQFPSDDRRFQPVERLCIREGRIQALAQRHAGFENHHQNNLVKFHRALALPYDNPQQQFNTGSKRGVSIFIPTGSPASIP